MPVLSSNKGKERHQSYVREEHTDQYTELTAVTGRFHKVSREFNQGCRRWTDFRHKKFMV